MQSPLLAIQVAFTRFLRLMTLVTRASLLSLTYALHDQTRDLFTTDCCYGSTIFNKCKRVDQALRSACVGLTRLPTARFGDGNLGPS